MRTKASAAVLFTVLIVAVAGMSADAGTARPVGRRLRPSGGGELFRSASGHASPHASAITGQSIAIDGGSTPGTYY